MARQTMLNWGLVALLAALPATQLQGQDSQARIFNTVKLKLANGQPVVGGTISTPDPDAYCAMANAGFDFMWIEMQHSALNYSQVAAMIWNCKDAPAIPFIRVPAATEGDIQKATDIGALGIIVPMVDAIEEIETAVTYAKYPPLGKRSLGGGQYGAIWGRDYRQHANENVMIVAMIEQPEGVAIIDQVVSTPGVDVVFVASADLGSFTGKRQGDPEYEALVSRTRDATLAAGLKVGGPMAWLESREGYSFFQGPGTNALIRTGAAVSLEGADPCRYLPSGATPVAGEDPCP